MLIIRFETTNSLYVLSVMVCAIGHLVWQYNTTKRATRWIDTAATMRKKSLTCTAFHLSSRFLAPRMERRDVLSDKLCVVAVAYASTQKLDRLIAECIEAKSLIPFPIHQSEFIQGSCRPVLPHVLADVFILINQKRFMSALISRVVPSEQSLDRRLPQCRSDSL